MKNRSSLYSFMATFLKETAITLLIVLIASLKRGGQTIFIFITVYTAFNFEALARIRIGTLSKWEIWGVITLVCAIMNIIAYMLERKTKLY